MVKKITKQKRVSVKKATKLPKVVSKPQEKLEKSRLQLSVVDVNGKVKGKVSVSAQLFGAKMNPTLVAQAVRVYLANQRMGTASTKTRGEVEGSTRKIYRQKGTGRARHGGIRAPIFVGGGITFGPKPRDYSLQFPQKMKRLALAAALSDQLKSGNIIVVDGLESVEPKTKIMAKTLETVGKMGKTLVVIPGSSESVMRSARNIKDVDIIPGNNLNTYTIFSHNKIIVSKDALPLIEKTFLT